MYYVLRMGLPHRLSLPMHICSWCTGVDLRVIIRKTKSNLLQQPSNVHGETCVCTVATADLSLDQSDLYSGGQKFVPTLNP